MPDANIRDHVRLTELRKSYDHAKHERNQCAMAQDVHGKLRWQNEIYRLSAEITQIEKRIREGRG